MTDMINLKLPKKQTGDFPEPKKVEVTASDAEEPISKKTIQEDAVALEDIQNEIAAIMEALEPESIRTLITESVANAMKKNKSAELQEMTASIRNLSTQLYSLAPPKVGFLTRKSLLLGISLLAGSLLTSGGIYYFFPQRVTLNRVADNESYKMFQQGTLLKLAFKKMPKVEQEKILKIMDTCWEDYYKELMKR